MRTLVLLIAVIAVVYILRYFMRRSGLSAAQIYRRLALYGLALLMLFLFVTGRLHWVFATVAAALPFLGRLLPLIRYVPLLRSWYRRYQASQNPAGANQATGNTSTVESRYLRMSLDHDSGEMDGEILQGTHRGKHLHELSVTQLVQLFEEFSDDRDSGALLQAYLDRVHSDWRDHVGAGQEQPGAGEANNGAASKMTEREAYEILGLQPGADKKQIIAAHRKLMQKLHPDRGGSVYLASKINLAKDYLLKKLQEPVS